MARLESGEAPVKTLIYRPMCVRRTGRSDTIRWARDVVRHPARYAATERERDIVRQLLAQIGATR
jgi:hypothetical protein